MLSFYIGTYSSEQGRGIYPLRYSPGQDLWELGAAELLIENASYAAYNASANVYYLLNEKSSEVAVCTWSPASGWQQADIMPSFGTEPCFVEMDAQSGLLAVANYGSGHIVTFALDQHTGVLSRPITVYDNYGRGPDAERQDGPHAHCVRFRGCWLYSTDLGTDSVLARRVGTLSGEESVTVVAFQAPSGEGPRHILFHPQKPIAYLLTELGSKLFVLQQGAEGELNEIERISTVPDGFQGRSLGGHMALNLAGDRLYVSNRGHDSLVVFAIAEDGTLTHLQTVPSGGESPRFFLLAEPISRLLVAHENGNNATVLDLRVDGSIGELKAHIPVPKPAFIGQLASPG